MSDTADGRRCMACRTVKPWSEFRLSPGATERKGARCRACLNAIRREQYRADVGTYGHTAMITGHRLRKYGLTPEAYAGLLAKQGGACGVCGVELASLRQRDVHVDHDHASGAVRGLLCHLCNTRVVPLAEGRLVRPELLARAVAYLRNV